MTLNSKHIVVVVSGGIAAYKSAEFVRALQSAGAQVRVAMTDSATRFVTPLTFQALSGFPVHTHDDGNMDSAGMDHISLARWADAIVVAPATANLLAKLSHGIADTFVTSLCLAHEGILAVAPAMNRAMWHHPATQQNINALKARQVSILGPADGLQACGESGQGRMLEPGQLLKLCSSLFSNQQLSGKHVVITAGPTIEPIDPVRFITNRSSGRMGYALADAAIDAGARVCVISGPAHLNRNDRVHYLDVETAQQMYQATQQQCATADIFIAAAAVSDYTPDKYHNHKIKKSSNELCLTLKRTPDILKEIRQLYKHLFCVGFAAETDNLTLHATEKLHAKSLDMIIANQVGLEGQGFDSDYNAIEIISPQGNESISRARKSYIARLIISRISNLLNEKNKHTNVSYL